MTLMAVAVGVGLLAFFVIILTAFIGGNWLLARFRKPKPPSEESIRKYKQRLLNPHWDELQEHFGLVIPEPLRNLYKQTALLTMRDLIFRNSAGEEWHIAEFYPADKQSLDGIWPALRESKIYPFAFDSVGDCYYVELTGFERNRCPVMYYHHDGSDVEFVSDSLEGFLAWHLGT